MNYELKLSPPLYELRCHEVGLLAFFCMLLEKIGEKEQFQYEEYDEKFDENDDPKRLAPRHVAEPVGI